MAKKYWEASPIEKQGFTFTENDENEHKVKWWK